jgi:hypothetical protein
MPIKYDDAKIPDFYSENLQKIIKKLLIDNPEERPSTVDIYYETITYYSFKYLKITSFLAALQCLHSIPSFSLYFNKSNKVKTIIENNENNEDKNYIITKTFQSAFSSCYPLNFNYSSAESECLKLRIILYAAKERTINSSEISPDSIFKEILLNIHDELNKCIKSSNNPGINNINNEDDNNNDDEEENIDFTNEKEVIAASIKKFAERYRSKISDLFFYLTKTVHECPKCQNKLKYSTDIMLFSEFSPERAAKYLNKTDLNIIDLFKHFRKKRLFLDINDNCQNCGTIIKDVNLTKIFYTSPKNLILEISNTNEDKYKLTIDEFINIKDFVERTDISIVDYKLIGAIFIEKNQDETKYISICRNIQ